MCIRDRRKREFALAAQGAARQVFKQAAELLKKQRQLELELLDRVRKRRKVETAEPEVPEAAPG
eukprot:1162173-Pyramimonas_sp.AAC.1